MLSATKLLLELVLVAAQACGTNPNVKSTAANNWSSLVSACTSSGTIRLSANFDSSDYKSDDYIDYSGLNLVIHGNNATLDSQGRGIYFSSEGPEWTSLELHSITIQNGHSPDGFGGGAIYTAAPGTLTICSSTFLNNTAPSGGAIQAHHSNTYNNSDGLVVQIHNSTFEKNHALSHQTGGRGGEGGGGALRFSDNVTATIHHSLFFGNTGYGGGAMYPHRNTNVEIYACRFERNRAISFQTDRPHRCSEVCDDNADRCPLGIAVGHYCPNNQICSACESGWTGSGGSINADATFGYVNLSITASIFVDNLADVGGGAFFATVRSPNSKSDLVSVTVCDTTFAGNRAGDTTLDTGEGGAISVGVNTAIFIRRGNFTGNKAGRLGGAIKAHDNSTVQIHNTTFVDSAARIGGAICAADARVRIDNSRFTRNHASSQGGGGAVYCSKATVHVAATEFTAYAEGGSNKNKDPTCNGIHRMVESCVVTFDCPGPHTVASSVQMQSAEKAVFTLPPSMPIVSCRAHIDPKNIWAQQAIIGAAILAGILFLIAGSVFIGRLRRTKAFDTPSLIDKTGLDPLLTGSTASYIIDSSELKLQKGAILGRGAEGFVVKGKFNGAVCAVKVVTLGLSDKERESVINEASNEVKLLQQVSII
jgi:hypothetical protein